MIFNTDCNGFLESDKERNLYYKIFCGCIFNELIPDNNLGEAFIKKLIDKYKWTCTYFKITIKDNIIENLNSLIDDFHNEKLHVSKFLNKMINTSNN